jgi:hypothetical protein
MLSESKSLAGWRSAPALNPKMRRGQVLFPVWPGDVVRVQRLHTVGEGTPDSGYRQILSIYSTGKMNLPFLNYM